MLTRLFAGILVDCAKISHIYITNSVSLQGTTYNVVAVIDGVKMEVLTELTSQAALDKVVGYHVTINKVLEEYKGK